MANLKDDIEKYLSGKLSPEEMHALEKKALDDPFLNEALEGGASITSEEFIADIKAMDSSLSKKQPVNLMWQWPLRIAAGLLLLAVSTYVVFTLTDSSKTKKDSIALNKSIEEVPQEDKAMTSDSISSESNVSKEEAIMLEQPEQKISQQPLISERSRSFEPKAETFEESTIDQSKNEKPDEVTDESDTKITSPSIVSEDVADKEVESSDGSVLKKKSIASESISQQRDVAQSAPSGVPSRGFIAKNIKGTVTDIDDGLPLPGVNVLVKDSKIGTITDLNGNFEINVPESQNNALVFSFIGMQSKEVTVASNDQPVSIQLAPDVSELSEVVVTGYGTGEEKEFEGTKWELTEPVGGKKAYKSYLEQNLRYPQVAIENNIQGKVTIQFTVEPSGQLTDFRVVKSLGSNCDDELIRLIKEGPKWNATKRNDEPVKSKAKVKMRFTLPKDKK